MADYKSTFSGAARQALDAAIKRFDLSEGEINQGLDAFEQWHRQRFGQGFDSTSSYQAIVNGAVQNALNARAIPDFYTSPRFGPSWYEGAAPLHTALSYADTPERIAAHREGEILGMANALKNATDVLDGSKQLGGFFGPLVGSYSPFKWDDDSRYRLAAVGNAVGYDKLNAWLKNLGNTMSNAGAAQQWWGPEAYIANAIDQLGADPNLRKSLVKEDVLNSQANRIGAIGQEAQSRDGNAFDMDSLTSIGGAALTLYGIGAGFAGALGLTSGASSAALADVGAQAAAAGDAGFLTAGGVATPQTGGMFVGNSGLLGSTGNAIADATLNGVVRGGATSALTGGDPVTGMISGGVSGGIGSMLPDLGSAALNNAAQGAVSGGVGAAVNGGDILTGAAAGGAASGVGTLVREAIPTDIGGNALTSAAAGGAAGAVGSAIAGGDVGTGLIRGAVTGGTTGALTDAGADPLVAGAAGTAAGGLITAPTPDAGTPAAQQQQTATTIGAGLGFSVVLPQFQDVRRRDMQWGSRLSGG